MATSQATSVHSKSFTRKTWALNSALIKHHPKWVPLQIAKLASETIRSDRACAVIYYATHINALW